MININQKVFSWRSLPLFRHNSTLISFRSPLDELKSRVSQGILQPNEEQLRTAHRLTKLWNELQSYEPPVVPLQSKISLKNQPFQLQGDFQNLSIPSNSHTLDLTRLRIDDESAPVIENPVKGLWIHGSVGSGKSMLMDLFYDSLPIKRKRRIHFHTFMLEVYKEMWKWQRSAKTLGVSDVLAASLISKHYILCFDEFQITDIATATILNQLFDRLFQFGLVLIVTSNRRPEELYRGGVQRHLFKDFEKELQSRCDVWELRVGSDFRREASLEKEGTRYDTLAIVTNQFRIRETFFSTKMKPAYDNVIQKLESQSTLTPSPSSLKLYARSISIPACINTEDFSYAKFTFDDLFSNDSALGPADFFLICSHFEFIVIQGIPKLRIKQKNEARRLITFIDAAYELKCNVVILADCDIDELLSGEIGESSIEDDAMLRESMGDLLGEISQRMEKPEAKLEIQNRNSPKYGSSSLPPRQIQNLPIFTAEEELFAFKRAESRLFEMSTDRYLSTRWTGKEHRLQLAEDATIIQSTSPKRTSASIINPKTSLHLDSPFIHPIFSSDPPVAKTDFASEASYEGYHKPLRNAMDESPLPPGKSSAAQIPQAYEEREKRKPRFGTQHFWGAGWWEKLVYRNRKE